MFETELRDEEIPRWVDSGKNFPRLNKRMKNFGLCRFIANSDKAVNYKELFEDKKQFYLYELFVEKDILEKERYELFGSRAKQDRKEFSEIDRRLWVIHGVLHLNHDLL